MAKRKPNPLTLAPDPANPNRMAPEDKARMVKSLAEFGDLSGVILNRRTGLLIGGHQRADVLTGAELHVVDIDKPEPDGTIGRGYLIHDGMRYSLRVVDWPEDKAHAALLAANRFGRVGEDDATLLKDLLEQVDQGQRTDNGDMLADLTGYSETLREQLATCDKPMKPVNVQKPPSMAWVLIGVPIGEWGKVAPAAEAAAEIEGAIVETTANDGIKEN